MYISIPVQWTYNDIHTNHDRFTWWTHKYHKSNINNNYNQFTKYFR